MPGMQALDPSDALAELTALLWKLEAGEGAAKEAIATALAMIEDADEPLYVEESCINGERLEKILAGLATSWPPASPRSVSEAASLIEAIQQLDRWHAPLLPHNHHMEQTAAHENARMRLFSHGRFNRDPSVGSLIPGKAPSRPYDEIEYAEEIKGTGVVAQLLTETAFLPPCLAADDPDNGIEDRSVALKFLQPASSAPAFDKGAVIIGIAPLVEDASDIRLWISECGSFYSIEPVYPGSRPQEAIASALGTGVNVLIFPEMTVREDRLDELWEALAAERERFAREKGSVPSIKYVFAGVWGGGSEEKRHSNYIIIADASGRIIARQDKLTHWNLNPAQVRRFGIPEACSRTADSLADPLREHTDPGETIYLLDLDDLGRVLTLVCSDMDKDRPGDWLLQSVRVDLLSAPIMDGTLKTGQPPNWIIKRAERAAQMSQGIAVVSNSMSLTGLNNLATKREMERDPAFPFMPVRQCVIGYLADHVNGRSRRVELHLDLVDHPSPVVLAAPLVECE